MRPGSQVCTNSSTGSSTNSFIFPINSSLDSAHTPWIRTISTPWPVYFHSLRRSANSSRRSLVLEVVCSSGSVGKGTGMWVVSKPPIKKLSVRIIYPENRPSVQIAGVRKGCDHTLYFNLFVCWCRIDILLLVSFVYAV